MNAILYDAILCDFANLFCADAIICGGEIVALRKKSDKNFAPDHSFFTFKDEFLALDPKIHTISEAFSRAEHENFTKIDAKNLHLIPQLVDLNLRDTPENLKSFTESGGIGAGIFQDLTPDFSQNFTNFLPAIPAFTHEKISEISMISARFSQKIPISARSKQLSGTALKIIADYAEMLDLPMVCTPFDDDFFVHETPDLMHETPKIAFSSEILKMMLLSREFGVNLALEIAHPDFFAHVFRYKTPQILVQTPAHHMILDDSVLENFSPSAQIFPPLLPTHQKSALKILAKSGEINLLTSAHNGFAPTETPFTAKRLQDLGFSCAREFFPLIFTHFVKSGVMDLCALLKIASKNPADFANFSGFGALKTGNLMLVDTHAPVVVQSADSPYFGTQLFGKILKIFSKPTRDPKNA